MKGDIIFMAADMNQDRINRWKCQFCGSKHKKVIEHIRKKDDAHVGCTIHCCNCGHLDTFAWTVNFAKQITCETEPMTTDPCVHCGLAASDLVNCKNLTCKYRPDVKEEKKPTIHSRVANPDDYELPKLSPSAIAECGQYHPELHQTNRQNNEFIPDHHELHRAPGIDLPGQVGPRYIPPYAEKHHPGPGEPIPGHRPEMRPHDPSDVTRPGLNENMPMRPPVRETPPRPVDDLVVPVVNGTVGKL